jgi:transposase
VPCFAGVAISLDVNSDYYLGVLNRLWARILRIRPEYREQGSWLLLHDNAPPHKSKIVRDFLARKGITALYHPSYSLDLAPADFWLLRLSRYHPGHPKGMYHSFKCDSTKGVQWPFSKTFQSVPSMYWFGGRLFWIKRVKFWK